jgi:hypothetical protein
MEVLSKLKFRKNSSKPANSIRADYSRLTQRMARPPLKAIDGLQGRINLKPNGITYVRPGEDFGLIQAAGNTQGIMDDLARLQRSINEAYYVDFFLILTQNIERQKTATEVAGIQGEKAALMSSFYGRLAAEFLEPVLEDLFSVELMSGRVPPPPDSLMEGRDFLRMDMVSPLAQMQKRYLTLGSSQQAIMEIAQLAQMKPDVLDNLNFDQEARDIANAYGLDKRVVYDMADVERMRQARAQQQQQMAQAQQQMAMMKEGSAAAANMSKVPPEMMEQMAGAMGGRQGAA